MFPYQRLTGDCAHPFCAGRCRPQLFLDLLPDLLHCHLGLLDGPLGCVKPARREERVEPLSRSSSATTQWTTRTFPCWYSVTTGSLNWLVGWKSSVSVKTTTANHFISFWECLQKLFGWIVIVLMWRSHCAVCCSRTFLFLIYWGRSLLLSSDSWAFKTVTLNEELWHQTKDDKNNFENIPNKKKSLQFIRTDRSNYKYHKPHHH